MSKVYVIITAGGVGQRFGAAIPKQFIEVKGKALLAWTIAKMNNNSNIDGIVAVVHSDYLDEVRDYAVRYHFNKLMQIVPGGATFALSYRNGVDALQGFAAADDIIMVHMATSPAVPDAVIDDSIAVAREHGNAFSGEPSYMNLAIKSPDGHFSDEAIDRDIVWGLMMPWSINYGRLQELYERAAAINYDFEVNQHLTKLCYDMGERLWLSQGSPLNIKLTEPDHLKLLEALLTLQDNKDNKII